MVFFREIYDDRGCAFAHRINRVLCFGNKSIVRHQRIAIHQRLMASQKVRPPALQRLFKTSTYNFTLEKTLRLVGRNFCLAI